MSFVLSNDLFSQFIVSAKNQFLSVSNKTEKVDKALKHSHYFNCFLYIFVILIKLNKNFNQSGEENDNDDNRKTIPM